MKKLFYTALILTTALSCSKDTDNSAIIKNLRINEKSLGANVDLGNGLDIAFRAEDDNSLKNFKIQISKGGKMDNNVVVGFNDFSTGQGDNIGGKGEDIRQFINFPVNATPGFYKVEIELKDDNDNITEAWQNFAVNDVNDDLVIDFERVNGLFFATNTLYVKRGERIEFNGEVRSSENIEKIQLLAYTKDQLLKEQVVELEGENYNVNLDSLVNGDAISFIAPTNLSTTAQIEVVFSAVVSGGKAETIIMPLYFINN